MAVTAALLPGLAGTGGIAYAAVSLLLLAALIYTAFRPQRPSSDVVVNLMPVFLVPLALAPLVDALGVPASLAPVAVVPALPSLFLLDDSLRRCVRLRQTFTRAKGERQITPTFLSLGSAALAVMFLAPVVGRPVLLLAGAAVLLYLVIILARVLALVPGRPFTADMVLKRVIAGISGGISFQLTSRTSLRLYCRAAPEDAWVRVRPSQFISGDRDGLWLELSFTPALAGECRPPLQISALDPHGLVQMNQRLEPLQLHVIPMAHYAEWLATRYLEQAEAGVISGLPDSLRLPRRGVEYRESRAYQPGDPLKDIDWKHTAKLNQLIVNTYGESGQRAAIIAANLEADSAAAADRLAFNLITVALTLARENIPAALAVYDRHRVVLHTGIIDTFEVLKQTLSLVRQITTAELEGRHLEPTDIAKVRRSIRQLQQAESEPARRLLEILNFEHRAVEESARNHPATPALSAVTGRVPAPATIFLVSQLNHDAEAVLVATEKLARRKFTVVPVENK
jgi:uncharacterized protein (DUF58 family)